MGDFGAIYPRFKEPRAIVNGTAQSSSPGATNANKRSVAPGLGTTPF
jgi:hypothetical protein